MKKIIFVTSGVIIAAVMFRQLTKNSVVKNDWDDIVARGDPGVIHTLQTPKQ